MAERELHRLLVLALLAAAGATFLLSLRVTAPYGGRHPRPRWSGPDLPSWLGWIVMELPQPVGLALCFVLGQRHGLPALVFLGMWMFHYAYRTLVYPFLQRGSGMSLAVVALGFVLNGAFSYVNGRWLFALGPPRGADWLVDPRFLLGALAFAGGWLLCTASDSSLRRLRRPGERSYGIPRGGAFRWVSSPNYLGEIVMWFGWSAATWSLAGLTIALVTAANLVPRALRNHRWYRRHFPDYPPGRRALLPYLL